MGRKIKYSKELKLSIIRRYLNGEGSYKSLGDEIGIDKSCIRKWVIKYQAFGESVFNESHSNPSYTKELKEQIDELMNQYANEEIDGDTYAQRMMELTTSVQSENEED